VNPSKLVRKFGQCLLFALGAWLLVGPLALLQIGAWAWMLVNYTQESSIQTAVSETFSGDRPCGLCKIISTVDSETSKTPAAANAPKSKDLKLMLGLSRPVSLPTPPKYYAVIATPEQFIKDPVLEEADPPPRRFV
jgi:hypothetical protein